MANQADRSLTGSEAAALYADLQSQKQDAEKYRTGEHGAALCSAEGDFWAVCICGWQGQPERSASSAAHAWSLHMRDAYAAGSAGSPNPPEKVT